MFLRRSLRLSVVALILAVAPSCRPAPLIAPPEGKDGASEIHDAVAPLIALPEAPDLSDAGRSLIYEFETGGASGYNPRPEWPGGSSGFTIGVGYDCGYFSRAVIASDWHALAPAVLARVEASAGLKGSEARERVRECHDILVSWQIATGVFDRVDVARTWKQCERAFPGFDDLRPNAQAALVSLVFNRGAAMAGANRVEMRAIRDLTASRDYDGIAGQLRKMVHVWQGTDIYAGMKRRRYAEAQLVLTP